MAPDEPSGARPASPVVLRIKLRYDDVEAMIARFAVNVGKTGLFLPTKSIQPVGTEIKFELRIATDQPVLVGVGRVKASRPPDPEDPGAAYGMAVELMRVTRESRDLILKMLERRKQLGLPEQGLPMPADVDAARRAEVLESGVKEAGSGAVPQMITPVLESAPVLTAPRRNTGPIAIAKMTSIEPLAPEPPRKKRTPVAELIASASGPIAAPAPLDGLDENVDVAAALARARALAAGADLDGELEALRDSAAAPIEIGIEAASAELARQLGGSAVSKSARWAPPPPTAIAEPIAPEPAPTEIEPPRDEHVANDEPVIGATGERGREPNDGWVRDAKDEGAAGTNDAAVEAKDRVGDEPVVEAKSEWAVDAKSAREARARLGPRRYRREKNEWVAGAKETRPAIEPPAADAAATPVNAEPTPAVPEDDEDDAPLFANRRPSFVEVAVKTEPAVPMIHDGADPAEFEEAHEVEPEQIHDEVHRLSDSDIEELENTQIGETPNVDENAFEQHAYATVPSDNGALADRLDRELDEAEREDMGFVPGEGMQRYTDEQSPFDPSLEAALVAAASADAVGTDDVEEIEDFEILAEADAEDADLLNAAAEHEVAAPAPEDVPSRPSFLNRLAFDDESGYHPPAPAPARFDDEFSHEPGPVDPRILSAGYALRAFDRETSTPDPEHDFNAPGTYTPIPSEPSYDEFDAPHGNYSGGIMPYVPKDAFDESDVIAVPPQPQTAAQHRQDEEDFPDLESALEALDVDLDDIGDPARSMPRAVVGGQRRRSASMVSSPTEDAHVANPRQPAGRLHKRATTEDGIVIDFEDDEE